MIICHKYTVLQYYSIHIVLMKGRERDFMQLMLRNAAHFWVLDSEYILLCLRLKTIETNLKNAKSEGTTWLLDNLRMSQKRDGKIAILYTISKI